MWIPFRVSGEELPFLCLSLCLFSARVRAFPLGPMSALFQETADRCEAWTPRGPAERMCALRRPDHGPHVSPRVPRPGKNFQDPVVLLHFLLRSVISHFTSFFSYNLQVMIFPPLPGKGCKLASKRVSYFSCGFLTPQMAENLSYCFRNR